MLCSADELQNIYVPQSDQCKKNEIHLDPKKKRNKKIFFSLYVFVIIPLYKRF